MNLEKGYEGREHAWVKHKLLESYLQTLLSIVAVTGRVQAITYVDCFAGPWGDESEDLQGTSIAISLRIISEVRALYGQKIGRPPIQFKAIYVEKDRASFKRLSAFLQASTPDGITSIPLQGDYFDRQEEILKLSADSFAFFFVDPKGWTDVGIGRLARLLKRPKSEFLINFMYDFFNRAVGMEKNRSGVEELIGPLQGTEVTFLDNASTDDRSDFIVRRYRAVLKAAMGEQDGYQPRSYHAAILNKHKERLHYHLVYLTRHAKGIVKFAQESQRVDFLQLVVHQQTKNNSTPQIAMFSAEEDASARFDGRINLNDVKQFWLKKLSFEPFVCDEPAIADMLEETGWLLLDFEKALLELIEEGRAENLDAKGKRKSHPVHFEQRERLRRVRLFQ